MGRDLSSKTWLFQWHHLDKEPQITPSPPSVHFMPTQDIHWSHCNNEIEIDGSLIRGNYLLGLKWHFIFWIDPNHPQLHIRTVDTGKRLLMDRTYTPSQIQLMWFNTACQYEGEPETIVLVLQCTNTERRWDERYLINVMTGEIRHQPIQMGLCQCFLEGGLYLITQDEDYWYVLETQGLTPVWKWPMKGPGLQPHAAISLGMTSFLLMSYENVYLINLTTHVTQQLDEKLPSRMLGQHDALFVIRDGGIMVVYDATTGHHHQTSGGISEYLFFTTGDDPLLDEI
jgi:hypothetical protein